MPGYKDGMGYKRGKLGEKGSYGASTITLKTVKTSTETAAKTHRKEANLPKETWKEWVNRKLVIAINS